MSQEFNNRVYGFAIVKSVNSNYNADFSGQPRKLPNGKVYATDKALKYSIRNYWKNALGEKVFYFKSLTSEMLPRTLDETYEMHFSKIQEKEKEKEENKTESYKQIDSLLKNLSTNTQKVKLSSGKEKEIKYFNQYYRASIDNNTKEIKWTANADKIKELIERGVRDSGLPEEDVREYITGRINPEESTAFIEQKEKEKDKNKLRKEILKNILSVLDVKLFGGTYAGKTNISIHGTCQITHGLNRFPEDVIYSEQIMSPFRNPSDKNKDSTMTTLGTQSKLEEGHYVHHFSVNPKNIEDDVARVEAKGLTQEDIDKLKEGLRKGASYYDSAAKSGTENELLFWIQLKEESKLVMPSFIEFVDIDKERNINLQKVKDYLTKEYVAKEIEKIEIFYNKDVTKVINSFEEDDKFLVCTIHSL